MSRKPRIHFPGAFYHVIARGNRLQKIFLEDEDYRIYLRFLREYKKRYPFFLYAYILMPNHTHFLVEVDEHPLSRLMQHLQSRYSRNFNIKYRKRGHLFHGRYQGILCQKDRYFKELSAYIHLNAVRAGLVDVPEKYPWSSYPRYVTDAENEGLVDSEFLLGRFSDRKESAGTAYASFVMDRISQGHREDFYQLKEQFFLGSTEFVSGIHRAMQQQPDFVYNVSLPEIVSKTSSVLDIPAHLFYSPTRNRKGAWGRYATGYLARKLGGIQIKNVAAHFRRDPVVISQGIKKLEQRLREETPVIRAITILEEVLTSDKEKIPT